MIPNKKLMCILLVFKSRRPLYRTGNKIATVTLSDLAALGHLSQRERQGVAVLPKVYRSAPFISACLENGNRPFFIQRVSLPMRFPVQLDDISYPLSCATPISAHLALWGVCQKPSIRQPLLAQDIWQH